MPWSGRVEVKRDGQWGTICGSEFSVTEGNVICRRLGYGTVKEIRSYGLGIGVIHFSNLRFVGSILLTICARNPHMLQSGTFKAQAKYWEHNNNIVLHLLYVCAGVEVGSSGSGIAITIQNMSVSIQRMLDWSVMHPICQSAVNTLDCSMT